MTVIYRFLDVITPSYILAMETAFTITGIDNHSLGEPEIPTLKTWSSSVYRWPARPNFRWSLSHVSEGTQSFWALPNNSPAISDQFLGGELSSNFESTSRASGTLGCPFNSARPGPGDRRAAAGWSWLAPRRKRRPSSSLSPALPTDALPAVPRVCGGGGGSGGGGSLQCALGRPHAAKHRKRF